MDRWVCKTAVVTGASSGIGSAISLALADAGIRVVGLARRVERVAELRSQVRGKGTITPRQCDVSNLEDVADTFTWIHENFGGVHIMINNAGVVYPGGITDAGSNIISEEKMAATIDTNLKGTVMCTKHAVTSMMSHAFDGHVININSIAGHYVPFSSMFNVYTSTKHGVTAFTASLQNELADHKNKIKVTSLSPGLVRTELGGVSVHMDMPALQPRDVADAVLYVLSTPPNVNALVKEVDDRPMTLVANCNIARRTSILSVHSGDCDDCDDFDDCDVCV